MKFSIKNMGLIKNSTLELGDLTVFVGYNNAGKTYIVYSLYGFLETFIKNFSIDNIQEIVSELHNTGQVKINLGELDYKKIFDSVAEKFSKELFEIFSAKEEEFRGAQFLVELEDPFTVLKNAQDRLSGQYADGVIGKFYSDKSIATLKIDYAEQFPCLIFEIVSGNRVKLSKDAIMHSIGSFILKLFFDVPFLLASERLGIPLFYRELDYRKIALFDQFQALSNKSGHVNPIEFFDLFDKAYAKYTLPIADNIGFIRSVPDVVKKSGSAEVAVLNDYILSMVGGVYTNHPVEGLMFTSKPRSKHKFALTANLWSSSVKSLAGLYFYIKHVARPGHLLIIDEPEIHLTAKNQLILARMLAACVSNKIKVIITTHSDFLVKEFNNLIMLHNLSDERRQQFYASKRGSQYSDRERLDPNRVKMYFCEKGNVSPCPMDAYGFSVPSMDETIRFLNSVSDDLMLNMDRR
ncbi:MAG: AAA family ATPase [Magnetococcales bacterium]|nr:AAA family ATPase [Magnetococcales bacterium]